MKKHFLSYYFDFFDQKLGDSPLVVALIGLMIFGVGYLSHSQANYSANVFGYTSSIENNIIEIEGKKYRIILEQVE